MNNVNLILIVVLITAISLISGIFFSFTIAVSPGLKKLSDIEFINSMKSINYEILNPLFYLSFFSPLILFPLIIYLHNKESNLLWLIISSFSMYIFILIITISINVPLNNQLESFDIVNSTNNEMIQLRNYFEDKWTLWNNNRTILGVISLILLILSQLKLEV
jgi:uncharacterized membrane protein